MRDSLERIFLLVPVDTGVFNGLFVDVLEQLSLQFVRRLIYYIVSKGIAAGRVQEIVRLTTERWPE